MGAAVAARRHIWLSMPAARQPCPGGLLRAPKTAGRNRYLLSTPTVCLNRGSPCKNEIAHDPIFTEQSVINFSSHPATKGGQERHEVPTTFEPEESYECRRCSNQPRRFPHRCGRR